VDRSGPAWYHRPVNLWLGAPMSRRLTRVLLIVFALTPLPTFGQQEQGQGQAPTPEALVERLNGPKFQDREAAGKALLGLGDKAVPALKAGLARGSAEMAERCAKLLADIRQAAADRFTKAVLADKEFQARFDHPVWTRWAKVIGDDRGAREFLVEVLGVEGAANTLAHLEDEPKAVATLYPAELTRLHDTAAARTRGPDGQARRSMSSCYSLGEAVYGVYLGTYAGATGGELVRGMDDWPADPAMEVLESVTHLMYRQRGPWSAEAVAKGEYQFGNKVLVGPKDKLLAANVLNRKTAPAAELALRWPGGLRDASDNLAVALPVARMACREAAFPAHVRAAGWLYLAEAGEKDYLPDIRAGQADATLVQQFFRTDEGSREYRVLVSDVSVAAQLLMHKQDPTEYGFLAKLNTEKRAVDRMAIAYGFADEATRAAAHKKARAWLAEKAKPSKK
jgi:hypothetical protein